MATSQSSAGAPANLGDTLNTTLVNAGTASQNRLSGAALVHQGRLAQQQRYAAGLQKQYGAKDAGTIAAQARVAATKAVIAQVNATRQQSSIPVLTLAANEWALQGNVYDANSQPLATLTVFLVDGQKLWQRQDGFSYTDETGYFVLKSSATTDSTSGTLYIEIANDKGLPIFLDTAGFTPVVGQAIYKKIVLTSQTPIGDPPQPIRELGIAPQGYEYTNPTTQAKQP